MSGLFTFDSIQSGALLLVFLAAGEQLSKKLRGRLPAVLLAGLMFMAVSWTGAVPADLMASSGFSALVTLATGLIIVSMGASMSLRTFAENWRVVALAVCTYLTQAGAILLVLSLLWGFDLALGGLPGGSMTALIIQQRAAELGHDDTIVLSVLFFSTQAIVGSLLAGHHVRRESARLLALPRRGQASAPEEQGRKAAGQSSYGALCRLYLTVWTASRVGELIGVNLFILCLLFGVLGAHVGFLDKETMKRSGAESFLFFLMMANIVAGFARATPAMFAQMLLPVALVFALEVGATYLVSPLLGRLLGFSRDMSVALGSNIMMGFPLNMMLSGEIAESLTEDAEDRAYLRREVAAKMVIAGLSTTTSLAVFAGGVLVNYMG